MENKAEIHAIIDNDDQMKLTIRGQPLTLFAALPPIIAHIIRTGSEHPELGSSILLAIATVTLDILTGKDDEEDGDNA